MRGRLKLFFPLLIYDSNFVCWGRIQKHSFRKEAMILRVGGNTCESIIEVI
jgi:hypothetical protein